MQTIIASITKDVRYDRQTKDYACFISIDGSAAELIGFARTHRDGETLCNEYAYNYLTDNHTPETAVELLMAA